MPKNWDLDDVREIHAVEIKGNKLSAEADETTKGPASIFLTVLMQPDPAGPTCIDRKGGSQEVIKWMPSRERKIKQACFTLRILSIHLPIIHMEWKRTATYCKNH